jgi:type III secretory pathway component EscV
MAEVNLEFLGAQLSRVLDEQRAVRADMRRMLDTLAGLSRRLDRVVDSIEHIRDDLSLTVKAEIGGLFANLETRMERLIADEIEQRIPRA